MKRWLERLRRTGEASRERARLEREIEDEFQFHIEQEADELVRQGVSPAEAHRQAVLRFGGVERHREAARDTRRPRWLEDLGRDLRFSARTLGRNPGFTAVAVLAIGMGVGASTAIFSVVNQVILRPLPFADPDRLVMIWEKNPDKGWEQETAAPANFLDLRDQVAAFEDVAAYEDFPIRTILTGDGDPTVVRVASVTGNFFDVLGVPAALGRTLRWEETWSGGPRVAVLSHATWRDRYGSDPAVLGTSLVLDGQPYEVVGVMSPDLDFPEGGTELWVPARWDPASRAATWFRRAHWVRPVGRLRADVSLEEANAQIEAVMAGLEERYPETNRLMGAGATPLHRFIVGDTRTALLVVLAAVGLLLLLACVNVGNLLLVRAMGRGREVALRGALGAGRLRLVRQMVAEGAALAAAGGMLGLLLGWGGTRLLEALQPPGLLSSGPITLDVRVLLFAVLVTAASGIVFGLIPALWSARSAPSDALREGGRSGSSRSARTATGALVTLEVALALLLVAGAGLLVRSFQRLDAVDAGFDAAGVAAMTVEAPAARYDTAEKQAAFFDELMRRVAALPGVSDAASVAQLPLTSVSWTSDFTVEGWGERYGTSVAHRAVAGPYFATMRVPLIRGRTFTGDETAAGPAVVVINETMARRFFPDEDPIGKRIVYDQQAGPESVWRTIIGVVGTERQAGSLAADPMPEIYEPFPQEPRDRMTVVARTSGDPSALLPALRTVLKEVEPSTAPHGLRVLSDLRDAATARERFFMGVLLAFATIALVLALMGVYGVTAQAARQRTREIGVRVALGARPADVLRLVAGRGALLIAAGMALGLTVLWPAGRVLTALLYEVEPTDPLTLGAVCLILGATGLAAALVPALRARRVEPTVALRAE